MTTLALVLVLSAAFFHASWNFLLKKAGGGVPFVWLSAAISVVIYLPLVAGIWFWKQPQLGWRQAGLMCASAVMHTGYYLLLDRGYRLGDLSLVYPLARGSGPLITMLCAVLLLRESPSSTAVGGALLIAGGAVALTGDLRKLRQAGGHYAVGFALMTGCLIAAYTLVDKVAVSVFLIPPLLQDWTGNNLGRTLFIAPVVLRDRAALKVTWRRHRNAIFGVALLCPLAYILVLSAMVFTPVSYIAPAREVSILITTLMGTHILAEGQAGRRLAAAAAMVAGVIALAVG